MDANFGIPAAVMEMLCGSTSDMLRILPALPAEWSEGEFSDLLTRTGAKASADWDMDQKEINLTLMAARDNVFDLKFPRAVSSVDCSNPKAVRASEYGDQFRTVAMKKGDQLNFKITLK